VNFWPISERENQCCYAVVLQRVVEGFIVVLPLLEFYYLLSLHAAVLLSAKRRNSLRNSSKEELPEKIDCIVMEDGRERAVSLALTS
jgi:hypothetical protein